METRNNDEVIKNTGGDTRKKTSSERVAFSIGHSNRSIQEFLELLRAYGITMLIDVRRIPASAHNPQFNEKSLSVKLNENGISYVHIGELGGLRRANKNSNLNTGWLNQSFRGYADYMQTEEFEMGLSSLVDRIKGEKEKSNGISTVVFMCAEAVPWRCHRSLISDALLARGFGVIDIISKSKAKRHALTSFAAVADSGRITYPQNDHQQRLGTA